MANPDLAEVVAEVWGARQQRIWSGPKRRKARRE